MSITVHKFGGASVKDADGFRTVADVLSHLPEGKKVVIVSATGKTTNALEKVSEAYYKGTGEAVNLLEEIKSNHIKIASDLGIATDAVLADLMDTFVEIEWVLEDEVQDTYDYLYDQIVSVGELVSTKILHHYTKSQGSSVAWLDVRGLIMTDNSYREAKVDWKETESRIRKAVTSAHESNDLVISQGFIGSTSENFTTTLGREGSDYTAGIFSFCLDAESLSIWKDVPGILTADPRKFENVTKIDRLDYREAIEMTYYGAKVIHPKTIKPLQNKSIPLYVRPFNDVSAPGTMIGADINTSYPPVVVIEENQTLLHISTKDFSYVTEEHLSEIFSLVTKVGLKVNMMRNTAISFSMCVHAFSDRVERFKEALSDSYAVQQDEGLELITIRHYDGLTRDRLTEGKIVYFEEIISTTIRMAVKDVPQMQRKK